MEDFNKATGLIVANYYLFPDSWNNKIRLIYDGRKTALEKGDLDTLEWLRDLFADRNGDLLSYKYDISPLCEGGTGIRAVLKRLWKAGHILRFASAFHTQSGRPQYIDYYIWEQVNGRVENSVEGPDQPAPRYPGTDQPSCIDHWCRDS